MSQSKTLEFSFADAEYTEFSHFLCRSCGIDLGPSKQYLVSTRMRRILQEKNVSSLSELIRCVEVGGDKRLLQEVIDVMTTNETFWFRDSYPFDYLENVLSGRIPSAMNISNARIWSAACSSGQEPYSISIIMDELIKKNLVSKPFSGEIIATDLSSRILESAKKAHYDKLAIIRGLSDERAQQYFSQINADTWKLHDTIKSRVSFRPLNLQESFFLLGKFHFVFCRNVLIYFPAELKQSILRKIHETLVPGGILFLGSSESVSGLSDYYQMVHCNPGVAYIAKERLG
jgi:chemotaxis protein methyltransferase CheR